MSFDMSPHFGEGWIGTDSAQVQQDFSDAGMLGWLKWHLDRGRVYRVVVSIEETNRPEDKRAAGRI